MQFAELFETMRPDQDGCICVAGLGFSLSNTYFNLCYECCVSSVVLVAAALQASQLATRDKRLSAARSVSLAAFILIGSQLAPALSYLPDAVQTGAIVDSTSLLLCVIETAEAPNASTLAAAPNASTLSYLGCSKVPAANTFGCAGGHPFSATHSELLGHSCCTARWRYRRQYRQCSKSL